MGRCYLDSEEGSFWSFCNKFDLGGIFLLVFKVDLKGWFFYFFFLMIVIFINFVNVIWKGYFELIMFFDGVNFVIF